MKALLATCTAGAAVLVMGTVAEATTFKLDSYNVNLNDQDPGLVLDWAPILGTPATADLEVGESTSTKLFTLWTDETAVNLDDLASKPISVDFTFSLPKVFGGTVGGETKGFRSLFGVIQGGQVIWDGPSVFAFGNGGLLEVTLSDTIFNKGLFGLNEGEKHGAKIHATFKLVSDHVDVPEPTALLGLGLLGLGMLAQRRRTEQEA
ncbi:PEP-CTERM sorting domain-containing protein [Leptolyngbya sp. PCC 6406]|uniref:PEP-CTERM sorting domain-containing protein n=1 Tax=Leptolyngbya sp. PCC 6406 TaxID=1173264 RepID=UPI0002AC2E69|nr:PEP-CTERM sorting domain-containing protein [Leptolyngbya sp. PCC 6406]